MSLERNGDIIHDFKENVKGFCKSFFGKFRIFFAAVSRTLPFPVRRRRQRAPKAPAAMKKEGRHRGSAPLFRPADYVLQDLHVGVGRGVGTVRLKGLPDDLGHLGGGAARGIHDEVEVVPVVVVRALAVELDEAGLLHLASLLQLLVDLHLGGGLAGTGVDAHAAGGHGGVYGDVDLEGIGGEEPGHAGIEDQLLVLQADGHLAGAVVDLAVLGGVVHAALVILQNTDAGLSGQLPHDVARGVVGIAVIGDDELGDGGLAAAQAAGDGDMHGDFSLSRGVFFQSDSLDLDLDLPDALLHLGQILQHLEGVLEDVDLGFSVVDDLDGGLHDDLAQLGGP